MSGHNYYYSSSHLLFVALLSAACCALSFSSSELYKPPPVLNNSLEFPHGTVKILDGNGTESLVSNVQRSKWKTVTQSMWYVSGCQDFFDAVKYTTGYCYKYEPAPGSVQGYALECHDDGLGFLQTNFIDDSCNYVEKTFNVSTNECVPGVQWPSIFQCVDH